MNRIINTGFVKSSPNRIINGNYYTATRYYQYDFAYAKHTLGYKTTLFNDKAKNLVYNFSNTRYATFFATEEELTMMLLSLKGVKSNE
jgi:hypothetical protein